MKGQKEGSEGGRERDEAGKRAQKDKRYNQLFVIWRNYMDDSALIFILRILLMRSRKKGWRGKRNVDERRE